MPKFVELRLRINYLDFLSIYIYKVIKRYVPNKFDQLYHSLNI